MKKLFKNFMALSLGLALVATACSKDEEDVVAGLNGNYTTTIEARIADNVVYPIQNVDPASLPFKVENAKGSEFTITGQIALNANLPGVGGAVIGIALQATNAQITKEELLGIPVYAGTFSIPAQTIKITLGPLEVPVSIAATTGVVGLNIIAFTANGSFSLAEGVPTNVTIQVSMVKD